MSDAKDDQGKQTAAEPKPGDGSTGDAQPKKAPSSDSAAKAKAKAKSPKATPAPDAAKAKTPDAPPKGEGSKGEGPKGEGPKGEGSKASDAPVPVTPTAEDERAAAEAAARRRVRRSRKVEGVETAPDETPSADEPDKPARRRRRSRSSKRTSSERGDGPDKPRPTEGRSRERSKDRQRERSRDRSRDQSRDRSKDRPRRPGAVGKTTERRVYRQDLPPGQQASPPPAEPADKTRQSQAAKAASDKDAAAKINEQDKITLILHPAPKAAPTRRKKKDTRPKTAKEALKAKASKRGKSAKAEPQAEAKPAAVELQKAWLTADLDSAAEIIAEAGAAGEALIAAWLEGNNTAAIARVAAMDELRGKVRKAARRALQVLKSRGETIPTIEQPDDQPEEDQPDPCVANFVPADANGVCFLSISQRQPGGRYVVADVMMSEPRGVMYASSGRIAGKQIRQWRNRVVERFGVPPVDVSVEWARYKIAEARKQNDVSKQVLPLGYDSCAAMISPAPAEPPPHPMAELDEDFAEAEISKSVTGSDALHADPEFRSWVPEQRSLDELLSKLGERIGTGGGEDPKVVDEALRAEVAAATDRFFQPDVRNMFADRMRDSAISVRQRAGDDAARRVLAVAQAIRQAGMVTSPPSEIPFLTSIFQKAIAMMARQGNGQLRVPVPQTTPDTE